MTNGLFTVVIDFGSDIFAGDARWLNISARTNGASSFTALAPRQPLTPAPYSLYAPSAGDAQTVLNGVYSTGSYADPSWITSLAGTKITGNIGGNAANITGTLPVTQLGTGTANISINGNAATVTHGVYDNGAYADPDWITSLSAAKLVGLSASQLTSGTVPAAALGNAWKTTGNAGTTPGANYLGTADSQALELKVNGQRALRLEPGSSPNVVGGHAVNYVTAGVAGATIGGGGETGGANSVSANGGTIGGGFENTIQAAASVAFIGGGDQNVIQSSASYSTIGGGSANTIQTGTSVATIAGGSANTIQAGAAAATIGGGSANTNSGWYATVPGGYGNVAAANFSFAAGSYAKALNAGSFVWADSSSGTYFSSVRNNEFAISAAGGLRLQSSRGVALDGADAPIITRGWDTFNSSAGPNKDGLGRWGLFMEPANLVLGIANYGGAAVCIANYMPDGTRTNLMIVDNSGNVTAKSFNPTSDRNAKENFASVDARDVLTKVSRMPICEWNFKGDTGPARHIGPMAQDFHDAFGLGTDDKHIATVDADGVALAAIQGLNQQLEQKEAQIQSLRQENQSFAKRLSEIEILVNKLARTEK